MNADSHNYISNISTIILEDDMPVFEGARTIDGLRVTVDGQPMGDHKDTADYSPGGIEWGYVGQASKQLAHAILMEHFKDAAKTAQHVDAFMENQVSLFDNEWKITSQEIDEALGTGS
tara:strand:+ start:174 stop:527 length:354 start_codon:yes stop_codon:yes gene_type:complete